MPNTHQTQEIELKLFVHRNHATALKNTINQLPNIQHSDEKNLVNRYFDTANLALRHLDMGLRVRGCNGALEQTIKTAGKVVGGLHSRPEYNVDITSDEPDLTLFPPEIWPETTNVEALQQQLVCLFSTDFHRTTWLISFDSTQVEVAFDQGEVAVRGQHDPISEVEFELFSGDASVLLTLAEHVAGNVPVRLGKASKAQRGYRLAGQQQPQKPAMCDADGLELSQWLNQWQVLEEAIVCFADDEHLSEQYWQWLTTFFAALPRVLKEDALDEQISGLALWLIGETQLESDLQPAAALASLQQQRQYGQLQLKLMRLLMGS